MEVNQPVQDVAVNNDKATDKVKRSLSIFKNIHYNAGVNFSAGRNQVGGAISVQRNHRAGHAAVRAGDDNRVQCRHWSRTHC